MLKSCNAIVYFYLLFTNRFYNNDTFMQQAADIKAYNLDSYYIYRIDVPWYQNKSIITNDNIFDINNLIIPVEDK